MLPKTKIRLSRQLRAQTTPYPEAERWVKRSLILIIFFLVLGIYFFGKEEDDRQSQPQTLPAGRQEILGEQESSPPQYLTYEVKKGDTLFNIAQRYEISWQTLAEINGLNEPYLLKIGQKIKIPRN